MNLLDLAGAMIAVLPTDEIQDELKELCDKLIDKAENFVEATPNKIDDAVVLPIITAGRKIIGVPDGDE